MGDTYLEDAGQYGPAVMAPKRLFTITEANAALVLIRRIITDVIADYDRLLSLHEAIESVVASGSHSRRQQMELEIVSVADRLQEYAVELDDVGVMLQDWSVGTVDFPSMMEDRAVCLCWELGEHSVDHWHEIAAGCSARQPVGVFETEGILAGTRRR